MRSVPIIIIMCVSPLAGALPVLNERALLDGLSGILGNDPVTMAKALPDKHIDPSPMGIDNIISTLPLPGIDLKRGLPLGLDGLLGGVGGSGPPSRAAKTIPKGPLGDGSMFSSFVPLDKNGDAAGPRSKAGSSSSSTPVIGELPLVGGMTNGAPLAPLKSILGVRGLDGKPKRDHKELARRSHGSTPATYSGAVELDDQTDAPYWY